ncbi:MAG: PAS domain-containing protein [Myxococcales bacterium]|nr:PAS domain-containing protein [Myxococcales bacterium]
MYDLTAGRNEYINPQYTRITGWTLAEINAMSALEFSELFHPDDRVAVYEHMNQVLETSDDEVVEIEYRFRHKNGSWIWCLSRDALMKGDETARRFIGTFMDVTDRVARRMESERQLSLIRGVLDAMLKGGDVAFWDWHLLAGWARVSDSYFTQLGFAPGAWVPSHKTWAERVHPEDIGAAVLGLKRLLSGDTRNYDAQYRMRDVDGEWRWILARGYVTERSLDGQPARVTGTHQDIQRLKLQEEQLRKFQKMEVLGQLTGGIAHDFNNILATISANLTLLELDAQPAQRDYLEMIGSAVRRATGVTSSLLKYSRQRSLTPEPIDVNERIRALDEVLRTAAGASNKLRLALAADRLRITAEVNSFESALLNLVVNARDAVDSAGGVIEIETTVRSASADESAWTTPRCYVIISIRDNGCGMTPEVLKRAVEPLYTTKRLDEGTGLGLSMVNKFASEARGYLRLESRVGIGTRAELALPRLVERPTTEVPSLPAPAAATRSAGTSVLIVDDEVLFTSAFGEQLRRLGYRVHTADTPRRALAELATSEIDLLLTDIAILSSFDGVELAQRAIALTPSIKVIFMTGYVVEELREAASAMGPVLIKPFSVEQLTALFQIDPTTPRSG